MYNMMYVSTMCYYCRNTEISEIYKNYCIRNKLHTYYVYLLKIDVLPAKPNVIIILLPFDDHKSFY